MTVPIQKRTLSCYVKLTHQIKVLITMCTKVIDARASCYKQVMMKLFLFLMTSFFSKKDLYYGMSFYFKKILQIINRL